MTIDSLTKEMARVRYEVIPVLEARGKWAVAFVARCTLERAENALADDDAESMAAAYEDLKGIDV